MTTILKLQVIKLQFYNLDNISLHLSGYNVSQKPDVVCRQEEFEIPQLLSTAI